MNCWGHPLNESSGHSPGIYYVYMCNLLQPSTHANQTDTSDIYYRRHTLVSCGNSQRLGHQLGFWKREKKKSVQRDRKKVVRLSRWLGPGNKVSCWFESFCRSGVGQDRTSDESFSQTKDRSSCVLYIVCLSRQIDLWSIVSSPDRFSVVNDKTSDTCAQ